MALGMFGYGLGVRLATSKSMFFRVFYSGSISMIGVAFVASWWHFRDEIGDGLFATIAIAPIALGVILFHRARRAWMDVELG
jgi:hypothetical protein